MQHGWFLGFTRSLFLNIIRVVEWYTLAPFVTKLTKHTGTDANLYHKCNYDGRTEVTGFPVALCITTLFVCNVPRVANRDLILNKGKSLCYTSVSVLITVPVHSSHLCMQDVFILLGVQAQVNERLQINHSRSY